jgi:hypothetical protein
MSSAEYQETTGSHAELHATEGGDGVPPRDGSKAAAEAGATQQEGQAGGPASPKPPRSLRPREIVVCALAILAWTALVAIGVAVPTKQYIDMFAPEPAASGGASNPGGASPKATAVQQGSAPSATSPARPNATQLIGAAFIIFICYTFTNVAMVSCLAALVGAVGRSANIEDAPQDKKMYRFSTICASGVIRGFFMFVLIASGTVVLADQEFENIKTNQYLKLVGFCSTLCFAVGYDPGVFRLFVNRISRITGESETKIEK